MAQSTPDVVAVEVPTTIEIDRRKLAALEGSRKELYATQRVLAVIAERLMKAESAEAIVVSDEAFETAPDLRASRDKDSGEVTVTVFR